LNDFAKIMFNLWEFHDWEKGLIAVPACRIWNVNNTGRNLTLVVRTGDHGSKA